MHEKISLLLRYIEKHNIKSYYLQHLTPSYSFRLKYMRVILYQVNLQGGN